MEYEKFVYTRDFSTDYLWHVKAQSLPSSFYKYMQTFICLRDELRNYEDLDWTKIIFFLKHKGVNIACRVLATGFDYVGRVIYSIEGIVCSDVGKKSIYAMPDIVRYFYSVDKRFTEENLESETMVEIVDTINPLIPIEKNETIPEEFNHNNAFKQFVVDVSEGKTDYESIVGPKATVVYSAMKNLVGSQFFPKVYDLEDIYPDDGINQESIIPIVCMDNFKEENYDEPVRLYIKFYKEGKQNGRYQWILRRESDDLCIKSERKKFVKGVSFERLFTEANKIKTYYSLLGLRIR